MSVHGPCWRLVVGVLLVGAVARLDQRADTVLECEAISPRAEPKSMSTGAPSLRMMMLSGAMSRCRKSALWISSSASSSGAMMRVELVLARRAPEALQPALEAAALLEVEHHVAGVVGAEVAVDAHDVGVVERGERLRFLDEAVEAPAGSRRRSPASAARHRCAPSRAAIVGREIFLDGDQAGERDLVGEIGDAEAAGAQHALDAVVADQLGPVRQRQQVAVDAGMGCIAFAIAASPRPMVTRTREHCPANCSWPPSHLQRAHSSERRHERNACRVRAILWRNNGAALASANLCAGRCATAMFLPSCSGTDLLRRVGNAATKHSGRAHCHRPRGSLHRSSWLVPAAIAQGPERISAAASPSKDAVERRVALERRLGRRGRAHDRARRRGEQDDVPPLIAGAFGRVAAAGGRARLLSLAIAGAPEARLAAISPRQAQSRHRRCSRANRPTPPTSAVAAPRRGSSLPRTAKTLPLGGPG